MAEFRPSDRRWDADDPHTLLAWPPGAQRIARAYLMKLELDRPRPVDDVVEEVMEDLGLGRHSVRKRVPSLTHKYGMISQVKPGKRLMASLTDRGVDFVNWLNTDPDGLQWGVGEREINLPKTEKEKWEKAFITGHMEDYKKGLHGLTFFEEGVVKWTLSAWGMVVDGQVPRDTFWDILRRARKRGMATAFIPAGYEVYVLEPTDERVIGRDGRERFKKIPHRVVRWSEFPITDRELIIDAAEKADGMRDELKGSGDDDEVG